MKDLSDQIRSRGEALINELCSEEAEETLHLEFKTLGGTSGGLVNKYDRQLLGKAICGLANAEGGFIFIGVASGRKDGLDFAKEPKPMAGVVRLRNRIAAWLPEALSPTHPGLTAHAIPSAGETGFIAIEVPSSDRRPHMSNSLHQYFRRGSGGTVVMEHGEVRDLFLAAREAILDLVPSIKVGKKIDYAPRGLQLSLCLQNVGQVAARDVFMRVWRGVSVPHPHTRGNTTERSRPDGSMMFTTAAGEILHVGDVEEMAFVRFELRPILPSSAQPPIGVDEMRSSQYWRMGEGHGENDALLGEFPALDVDVKFGAANAVAREVRLTFTSGDIVRQTNMDDLSLRHAFGQF